LSVKAYSCFPTHKEVYLILFYALHGIYFCLIWIYVFCVADGAIFMLSSTRLCSTFWQIWRWRIDSYNFLKQACYAHEMSLHMLLLFQHEMPHVTSCCFMC
jgi:hypothetical protein